jgi:hypothetical protein
VRASFLPLSIDERIFATRLIDPMTNSYGESIGQTSTRRIPAIIRYLFVLVCWWDRVPWY